MFANDFILNQICHHTRLNNIPKVLELLNARHDALYMAHFINNEHQTPIEYACSLGRWDLIKAIADKYKISENKQKQAGYGIATFKAASKRRWDVVQSLLQSKIYGLHDREDYENNTFLHFACSAGELDILKECGESTNFTHKNEQGHTPLLIAARNKHWDIVEHFIFSTGSEDYSKLQFPLIALLAAENKQKDVLFSLLKLSVPVETQLVERLLNAINQNFPEELRQLLFPLEQRKECALVDINDDREKPSELLYQAITNSLTWRNTILLREDYREKIIDNLNHQFADGTSLLQLILLHCSREVYLTLLDDEKFNIEFTKILHSGAITEKWIKETEEKRDIKSVDLMSEKLIKEYPQAVYVGKMPEVISIPPEMMTIRKELSVNDIQKNLPITNKILNEKITELLAISGYKEETRKTGFFSPVTVHITCGPEFLKQLKSIQKQLPNNGTKQYEEISDEVINDLKIFCKNNITESILKPFFDWLSVASTTSNAMSEIDKKVGQQQISSSVFKTEIVDLTRQYSLAEQIGQGLYQWPSVPNSKLPQPKGITSAEDPKPSTPILST